MLLNNDISVTKMIMILYLFIFANVISTNINKKLIDRVENNIIIKHILGLITVGVLLSLVYKNIPLTHLVLYSVTIYFVFLLSTKIATKYILLAILILAGVYFFNQMNENKIDSIKTDQSINLQNKESLIKKLESTSNNVTYFYIGAVIFGSLLYDQKKSTQFGGSYSVLKMLN